MKGEVRMFPKHEYLNSSLYLYQTDRKVKSFPTRFHKHLEFCLVNDGVLKVNIDGVSYTLEAGDIYIVFPNLPHSIEEGEVSGIFALVDTKYLLPYQEMLAGYRPTIPVIKKAMIPAILYQSIQRLMEIYSSDVLQKNSICTGYLNSLLGEFTNLCTMEKRDANNELVQQLAIYFMDHFSEEIKLETVAKDLNYSKYYISHIITKTFHCNFRSLINSYRIGMAQNLLINSRYSIGEVSVACGFKNQSSFNRSFTKQTGISPGIFRRQNQKSLEF